MNDNKQPCQIDLINEKEIIQYIRDLINLTPFLKNGFDAELLTFIKQLKGAGWGKQQIDRFITLASYNTVYENAVNVFGERIVPVPIKNRGDWKEWLKIKSLHK